ncbi:MAG: hypothetical protein ACR2JB_22950, partial [Bryobacteraceae bacterium]
AGDLDLLRAVGLRNSRELERRSRAWRPWRAYAAVYLWSIDDKCKAPGSKPLSCATKEATA